MPIVIEWYLPRKRELIFKKIEDPKRKLAGIGLMLIVILALGAIIMDSGIKTITTDSSIKIFGNPNLKINKSSIKFNDVSFSYPTGNEKAIKNNTKKIKSEFKNMVTPSSSPYRR